MNHKLSYFHFVSFVAFFLLGCSVSSLFFILNCSDTESSLVHSTKVKVKVIVLILSSPDNRLERNVIRNSWLKSKRDDVVHFFAIGIQGLSPSEEQLIYNEVNNFNDIQLLELIDSYRNLTYKVAKSIEDIVAKFNFKFLLKVDDDTFVDLKRLTLEADKFDKDVTNIYWGYFSPSAHVFSSGRWRESSWYLSERYLPYALGGGYILGYNLASYIARNHQNFKYYNSEDVSVGVWLSPLNTHRIHDIRFDTQAKTRGCFNDDLIKHKVKASDMSEYAQRVNQGMNLCRHQYTSDLKPYSYNWMSKPSKCCIAVNPMTKSTARIYSSRSDTK